VLLQWIHSWMHPHWLFDHTLYFHSSGDTRTTRNASRFHQKCVVCYICFSGAKFGLWVNENRRVWSL
jgi:hypothetical protein